MNFNYSSEKREISKRLIFIVTEPVLPIIYQRLKEENAIRL